jgi:putative ABC transport system permease protein
VGVGVALAAALAPAREAGRVSPVEAMARGQREYAARLHARRDLVAGVAVAAAGAFAATLPPVQGKPLFGYLAALLLIAASALALPAVIQLLAGAYRVFLERWAGVEPMLASRSLVASLWRTSVLVGALSTAVAMMVSVGVMVGSFRQTVLLWMDNQLKADLYLRPAGMGRADRFPTMAPEIADAIEKLPAVAAVDRFRAYTISYNGMPATLGAGDTRVNARFGRTAFLSGQVRDEIFRRLPTGDYAIISEPFANKHNLRAGDDIRLPIGDAERRFRILGVYYDYASERGYVILDRNVLLRYLPDPAPSSLAVFAVPGRDLAELRAQVERVTAGREVMIFTNRTLRTEAIRIFDRTFAITYALEAVAIVVAVIGIAGALLALVIDRRREFGLLRFLGASAGQIRRLILFEAGFIGLLSNLIGLGLGFVLSLLLIYVINRQSFGWTIQFHTPVWLLVSGLMVVYLATILAGLYPSRTAVRLNPIEVIHEE